MAHFNIDLASHKVHSFLQRRKLGSLVIAVVAGAAVGSLFIGSALYQTVHAINPERDASLIRLNLTKASIEALKKEKAAQGPALEKLVNAPKTAQEASLNASGFTEDDVNYWRKQMDAFAKMTGVQMTIVGRGPSRFQNSTKLSVNVALSNTGTFTGMTSTDLIKALDFLQLYGYVESFNGSEAVVHVSEINKS